jgi:hypothetical protein
LHLADVGAGLETVGRDLMRRGDNRLGIALANTAHDELEKILQVTTARLGTGRFGTGMALIELGNCLVHKSILRTGKDF